MEPGGADSSTRLGHPTIGLQFNETWPYVKFKNDESFLGRHQNFGQSEHVFAEFGPRLLW